MTITITDTNFDDVLTSDKPVLVDFWAPWCGPCKAFKPTVDAISEELTDTAVVGTINVDENPQSSVAYGIRSLPTVILFNNGEIVERIAGTTSKQMLVDKLNALIDTH